MLSRNTHVRDTRNNIYETSPVLLFNEKLRLVQVLLLVVLLLVILLLLEIVSARLKVDLSNFFPYFSFEKTKINPCTLIVVLRLIVSSHWIGNTDEKRTSIE